MLNWEDGRRAEIRKAIEAIGSTGITILTQTPVVLLEQVTWALLDRNAVVSPSRKPVPIQPSNRAALETNFARSRKRNAPVAAPLGKSRRGVRQFNPSVSRPGHEVLPT